MDKNLEDYTEDKNNNWIDRVRYIVSLLSVFFMLLQSISPVVVAAVSMAENESQSSETSEVIDTTVSEPVEIPTTTEPVVVEQPVIETTAELVAPPTDTMPEDLPQLRVLHQPQHSWTFK